MESFNSLIPLKQGLKPEEDTITTSPDTSLIPSFH